MIKAGARPRISVRFGGGLALVLGEAAPIIMVVVVAKTVVDLRAHLKEHQPGKQQSN